MSKHEPLFKIGDKYLYREQNLITVQVPVFFVCKDEIGQRYLVLLADFNDDAYILCPVSDIDLYNMLMGDIVMRKLFLDAEKIYSVQAGSDLKNDKIKLESYDEIKDILPDEGAYFEMNSNDPLKQYALSLCLSSVVVTKRAEILFSHYKTVQSLFILSERNSDNLKSQRRVPNAVRFERSFFNERCQAN